MARPYRRKLSACSLSVLFWASCASAQTGKASPQQMLDFLAKPAPATGKYGTLAGYPKHYADWTEEQKRSGLQSVALYCGLANAMEHDDPSAHFLPKPMTGMEEAQLAVSVCVPPKMPEDWPDRGKFIDTAQKLIERAAGYGVVLHLPDGVAPR